MAGEAKSRSDLIALYKAVMAAVVASGAQVILFYGTLLGYKRCSDFIDGDDDVDVLIAHSDLPAFQRVVEQTGGLSGRLLGSHPRQIYQVFADGIGPFDVYPYYVTNGGKDVLDAWEGMLYDACDVFPTQLVDFHGFSVLVPRNPHTLLEGTYGTDYMTPMQKGSYVDSVGVRRCSDVARTIGDAYGVCVSSEQ